MASHSWEAPAPSRTWEPPPDAPGFGWGGECSDSEGEEAEESWGMEFVRFMVNLLSLRVLNARQFCLAMYYAGRAGVGEAVKYGFPPGKQSGSYQRHLNPLLTTGSCKAPMYEVNVPGHSKHDLVRATHTLCIFCRARVVR